MCIMVNLLNITAREKCVCLHVYYGEPIKYDSKREVCVYMSIMVNLLNITAREKYVCLHDYYGAPIKYKVMTAREKYACLHSIMVHLLNIRL